MFCEKERKIPRSPPYAAYKRGLCVLCASAAGQQRRLASKKLKTPKRLCGQNYPQSRFR